MKTIIDFAKAGFGIYLGWTIAKELDLAIGKLYIDLKRKNEEDKYCKEDIKNTVKLAQELHKENSYE